ncbi:hypothetical protein [Nocardia sp. Marseille-Q1738]
MLGTVSVSIAATAPITTVPVPRSPLALDVPATAERGTQITIHSDDWPCRRVQVFPDWSASVTAEVHKGSFDAPVEVPDQAVLGRHSVRVACLATPDIVEKASVEIVPARVVTVTTTYEPSPTETTGPTTTGPPTTARRTTLPPTSEPTPTEPTTTEPTTTKPTTTEPTTTQPTTTQPPTTRLLITPPPTNPTTPEPPVERDNNIGIVIGIVLAIGGFLLALAVAVLVLRRRQKAASPRPPQVRVQVVGDPRPSINIRQVTRTPAVQVRLNVGAPRLYIREVLG